MKIRIDALYDLGLWPRWCQLNDKNPEDKTYLEERWLDLITVPPEMEDLIMHPEQICKP